MSADRAWLALDVGGANLKGAHSTGTCRSRPFAVWKSPGRLPGALCAFASEFPPFDALALTSTAESCDCFATKAEGVAAVLDAAARLADGRAVAVWGLDGAFHAAEAIRAEPWLAMSSNWLALATVAARLVPGGTGLLVDIGSTTADLIPLADGRPAPVGRTDSERLRTGELVYAGVSRTPVCALATALPWRGAWTGLAAELFATTRDVYLTLGDLPPDPSDLDTADGRSATVEAARDRLARMVGADRESFTVPEAREFAEAADAALFARLVESARRACETIRRPAGAVVSGSGEFLATRVARAVVAPDAPVVPLGESFGPEASVAACASALLRIIVGGGLGRCAGRSRW